MQVFPADVFTIIPTESCTQCHLLMMLLLDAVVVNRRFESYALQGYYTAQNDNSLPTFRDKLSVPSSRINKSRFLNFLNLSWICRTLKMGPIGTYTLRDRPERRGESLKSRTEGLL